MENITTTENQQESELHCKYCNKECKSPGGKGAHERGCSMNPANKTTEVEEKKVLTPEEAALVSRIASEDIDWFTIREDEINDFSLMTPPGQLPPVAQKLQDEKVYAFRWCKRSPERVDQLCKAYQPPLKWAIVNKTTLPALSDLVDPTLGCICELDQMLLFKPWSHHARVQAAKRALADNQSRDPLKDKEHKSKDGYETMAGREHKIKSGDDIRFDEGHFDETGEPFAEQGVGDLVEED